MIRHLTLAAMLMTSTTALADDVQLTDFDLTEIDCLARNVYFEARNQTVLGQIAVASVVLNRVKSSKFPSTICGVVYQGGENRRHRCQFSWYCDGRTDRAYEVESWKEIYDFSLDLYKKKGFAKDITDGAVYYHATYVDPYWVQAVNYTITIDDHRFYARK